MRTHFILTATFAALALAPLARTAAAAWSHDPFENTPVCTAPGDQYVFQAVSDGTGGAIIVWRDPRSGNYDIYAQRLDSDGTPVWGPDGMAIASTSDDELTTAIASDGAGGAIIAWSVFAAGDYDIYAQRVSAGGIIQWTPGGVPLSTAAGDQNAPLIVSDGAEGAIVAWRDQRGTDLDIYAQRVDAAGVPQWTTDGIPLCTAVHDQTPQTLVGDEAGGAILAWQDFRNGVFPQAFAQRVNALGAVEWTPGGALVSPANSNGSWVGVVSDGAGGAVVAWSDFRSGTESDVYAQRLSAVGGVLWPGDRYIGWSSGSGILAVPTGMVPDGGGGALIAFGNGSGNVGMTRIGAAGNVVTGPLLVSPAPSTQAGSLIVSDGSGGVIMAYSVDNTDFGSQRLNSSLIQQWGSVGPPFTAAIGQQALGAITSDAAGGAILAWRDDRNLGSTGYDVYAQRIDRFGFYGNPRPAIAGVHDIANDQGGKLRVSWTASYLDADPDFAIAEYRIWRSVPDGAAALALRAGDARLLAEGEAPAARNGRALDITTEAGQTIYWEYVGSQIASGDPAYQFTVPTTSDSTPDSNPFTKVRVQALHTNGTAFWSSEPDSGYSVDNLPPSAPASFTAIAGEGGAQLAWAPSTDADFDRYRLYRGSVEDFVPGPGTLIAEQSITGFADAEPESFYKLSAVDAHGNESPFATASPGVLDAPAASARTLALARPSPNPAGHDVVFGFTLPRGGAAALDVFDAGGRRVRALYDGALAPGAQSLRFDLRDDGGRMLGSGLYFVRLRAEGRMLTNPFVVVR